MKASKLFSALVLALAVATPAVAADEDDPHWVTLTVQSEDDLFSQVFDSEVVSSGFSFELKGSTYGYFLTLQVGSDFADQTGLIGYQIGRKIDGDSTWYKLQQGKDPQTYNDGPVTLADPGLYWMRLAPLNYGSNSAQPLSFAPASVPSVPEPETWAMMALGLAAVGWAARRR